MATRLPVPAILAIAFELLFILCFKPLVSFFGKFLSDYSVRNPILIAGVYIALCVAVVFIRKLETTGGADSWRAKTGWLGLPALCFGFLLLHLAAETGGFYRWIDVAERPAEQLWVPLSAVGGIGLALVYFFTIIVDIKPKIGQGLRREVTWGCCMVVAQLMIVILAAWWQGLGAGSEPNPEIGMGGKILIFVVVYLFFLLFFASPRLLLLAAEFNTTAALTFVGGTCYYVWSTLDGTVWP